MSFSSTIPLPPDLPVVWERPEDDQVFWTTDPMHFPNPLTKLDELLARAIYAVGLNHSFVTYHFPVKSDYRCFWSHLYYAVTPLALSEDEMSAMAARSEAKLGDVMAHLMERWETRWLPEIREHLDYWEQFDLQGAPALELVAHLDETLRRMERVFEIHFEIATPCQLPVSVFDEYVREVFGGDDAFLAYRLIQGYGNLTVRAGSELFKLAKRAQAEPEVRVILETRPAPEVIPVLETNDAGKSFLEALRGYLNEHGRRGEIWGLSYPSWIEDPTPVIRLLQDYLSSDRDPDLELAALAAEREQVLAGVRDRLRTYPEPVREKFEQLLRAARDGNILSEDHNYWIDFRACYEVRRVFMECGRRLAEAGIIEHSADVVHLSFDEIRDAVARMGDPGLDLRDLVNERRAEIQRYALSDLPPAVGTPPSGERPVNPISIMSAKFFGSDPPPSDDPNVINGAAGSPGVTRGTARVIRSLEDASRIQRGDVLVAPTTAPSWTPLFATVSAVVTDTGGVLSHCAVVAREYSIPAVVGTGVASDVIFDGQTVEVDGDRGIVRIIVQDGESSAGAGVPPPQPIRAPENFPVEWQHPDDERLFWTMDRVHWPDAMTPQDAEFMQAMPAGYSRALASYGVPLRFIAQPINYYWYATVVPTVSDQSEMQSRLKAGIGAIQATIPRLQRLWSEEWLPEVQQHLAFWRGFGLTGAAMAELVAHLEETRERHRRVWQIHFLQHFPTYMTMSMFGDLYQDLFGNENALDAYRLLQGFDNTTIEMGRALWRLSRQVLASPAVRACFEESAASEVISALARSDEGRAFLSAFQDFLDTYGRRGEKMGVSYPSWIEDPAPAVRNVQQYVSQPELDFDAETARLVDERERALAEARDAIKGYPQPVRDQFESLLAHAQQAIVISEDHAFYIDFASTYYVRRVLLELGRRFAAANALDSADDIFLLTLDELRETAEHLQDADLKERVLERQEEIDHFRAITPPAALGTPPAGPARDDPLSRIRDKFFGGPPAAPDVTSGPLLLRGSAGSPGKVRGTARVIRSLRDAGRLMPGEILVAPTTAAAWTPLFATAAAVVTDTGGILSHCAVVAREYSIPAVVGTGVATEMIADGQTVEVDGDLGTVRIVES